MTIFEYEYDNILFWWYISYLVSKDTFGYDEYFDTTTSTAKYDSTNNQNNGLNSGMFTKCIIFHWSEWWKKLKD